VIHQDGSLQNAWISGNWSESPEEEKPTTGNSPGGRRLMWENVFRLFQNRELNLCVSSPENSLATTLPPTLGSLNFKRSLIHFGNEHIQKLKPHLPLPFLKKISWVSWLAQ